MIKRPLDPRFSYAVLQGRKVTTIRSNPWPIGVPIMLYNWSGLPYRSKHKNVCAVIAERTMPIQLSRSLNGNVFETPIAPSLCEGKPLYECEGFDSVDDFYDWFRPLIKPGQTITKTLIRFRIQTNLDPSPMPEDQECVMCGHDHDYLYVDAPGAPYGPLCETCFTEVMEPDTDN